MEDRGPAPAAPIPGVSETPASQADTKCWCHSLDQGVPTLRQEEEEMVDIDNTPLPEMKIGKTDSEDPKGNLPRSLL